MLDEFEGDEYTKEPVEATLLQAAASGSGPGSGEEGAPSGGGGAGGAGAAAVGTVAYIWVDSLRGYLYGEWDPQEFRCAVAHARERVAGHSQARHPLNHPQAPPLRRSD